MAYEAWPRISLIALPYLRPCTRTTWSKEPETTCEPSREKRTHLVRVGVSVRARARARVRVRVRVRVGVGVGVGGWG